MRLKLLRNFGKLLILLTIVFCILGLAILIERFYSGNYHHIEKDLTNSFKAKSYFMKERFESIFLKSDMVLASIHDEIIQLAEANTPREKISAYLKEHGDVFRKRLNLDFSILYGYLCDVYVDDGSWNPPEGYNVGLRPWYTYAIEGKGEIVVVPPYLDPATGKIVITVSQMLPDGKSVIAIDSYFEEFQMFGQDENDLVKQLVIDHNNEIFRPSYPSGVTYKDEWIYGLNNLIALYGSFQNIPPEVTVNGEECSFVYSKYPKGWGSVLLIRHEAIGDAVSKAISTEFLIALYIAVAILVLVIFSFICISVQKAKIESSLKAKSLFFSMVSHEIRTPLNAINGFSRILKDCALDKQTSAEYLENIISSGNDLSVIINDILTLSKLEANKLVIKTSRCDFPSIITEVVQVFELKLREMKTSCVIDTQGDFPFLELDQLRLKQILLNLVGNAAKFTADGTITIRASFEKTEPGFGKLVFSVIDTGTGILPQKLKSIVKPFESSNSSKNRDGIGLGLPICQKIINQMNGILSISSEVGKGSTFTVTMNNVMISKENTEQAPAVLPKECSEKDQKQLKLLLCDDVSINLKVLSAMLERKFSASCVCVNSGEKAIKILEKEKFDALLTDLWMPDIDGSQLARQIRENPATKDLLVFCISADVEVRQNIDCSIFTDVIFKPVTIENLQDVFTKYNLMK